MATEGGPKAVTDDLVLYLDAANVKSLDTRNLLHNTNSFTGWTPAPYNANVVITPNSTISPDGNLTATKFQFNDAAAYRCSCRNALIKLGNTNTFSVYAKAVSGSATIMLDIGDQGNKNFTVNDTEWTRCHITHTRISQYGDTTNFADITANAGTEIYLWGAQLNHGGLIDYVPVGDTTMSFNDLSNNGNGGALVNGPVFDFANGGSISFDGINDGLTVGCPIDMRNDFTLSVMYFYDEYKSNAADELGSVVGTGRDGGVNINRQSYLVTTKQYWQRDDNTGNGIWIGFGGANTDDPNTAQLLVSYQANSLAINHIYSSPPSTVNTWTELTAIKRGSKFEVYKNGYLYQSINISFTPTTNSFLENQLAIGGGFLSNYSKSNISKVSAYDRALSAEEVLQNYNATKSRFNL